MLLRALGIAGLIVWALACGKDKSGCPDGYVCIPVGATDAGTGADGGATAIATQIQTMPRSLVSDGTSLYWISSMGSGTISSMPVTGGAMTTVVSGPLSAGLLRRGTVSIDVG